jgi:hypothetical protein
MQGPELVPDLLLGPASNLPPDPPPVRRVAQRDGPDVAVLGGVEIDRVLAVSPPPGLGLRDRQRLTLWLPVWLPGDRLKISICL